MTRNDSPAAMNDILEALKGFEERLARIEHHLGIELEGSDDKPQAASTAVAEEDDERLEVQLGENWFAKVGIVVLALGIVFLLTFPYSNLPPALPSLFGYMVAGAIVVLSRFWSSSYPQISRYLLGGALLLLFFTTLRLSHFSPQPALSNSTLEALLLLAVVSTNLVVSARRRSPYLAGMTLVLGFATALVEGGVVFLVLVVAGMSVAAVYLRRTYGWEWLPLLGVVLANLAHTLWAINNPVLGNPLHLVDSPEVHVLFLLVYAGIFATGDILRTRDQEERPLETVNAFLNGGASYAFFLLFTLSTFTQHIVGWHLVASAVYLALAVGFWIRRKSRYATFAYAMLGYTALSVAIVAQFNLPDSFAWLCWQGILVVSTAVWFRSRFIVVGNFVIYVLLFIAYLVSAGSMSLVSISFGVVALVTARILNWQKDRLELRTEQMRNAYLASALVAIPYALYHIVPPGFVSLSWLCLAAAYYLVSRFLHLRKYRWMALLTTALTILYVVIVDMMGVNPTLRIISFLVLGTALLVISMVYSKRARKS
jgi:uncharacterized membrane protein